MTTSFCRFSLERCQLRHLEPLETPTMQQCQADKICLLAKACQRQLSSYPSLVRVRAPAKAPAKSLIVSAQFPVIGLCLRCLEISMDNFEMSCCSLGFLDSCHFEFACGARHIVAEKHTRKSS